MLTERCGLSALNCSAETQQSYVMDMLNMKQAAQANFTKATFEGSTHYVLVSGQHRGRPKGPCVCCRGCRPLLAPRFLPTHHTQPLRLLPAGGGLACGAAGGHVSLAESCD